MSILTIFGAKWKQDTTCLKDWKNLCESVILLDISSFVSCLEEILFAWYVLFSFIRQLLSIFTFLMSLSKNNIETPNWIRLSPDSQLYHFLINLYQKQRCTFSCVKTIKTVQMKIGGFEEGKKRINSGQYLVSWWSQMEIINLLKQFWLKHWHILL